MRISLMVRRNELEPNFSHVFVKFKSVSQAVRYFRKNCFISLGEINLSRGLYYDKNYKQIMIGREYAARDSLAMLTVSEV